MKNIIETIQMIFIYVYTIPGAKAKAFAEKIQFELVKIRSTRVILHNIKYLVLNGKPAFRRHFGINGRLSVLSISNIILLNRRDKSWRKKQWV
ncbi:hypothetical protein NZ45_02875 [Clostridium botulinum]|jgi:hypothetical protein|uniref:Transposase n=1 Tax=Clostridium botulinum TaxID=1491 RepID=A0ABD7CG30_CLOBO|nr:hypothetical protein [Clostridium botulinum]KGO15179.1 hypothetical protein NZ45_02875 [Clostridium botulinum]QRI51914.1 hypothetical protein JQS73_10605 [Clostridium botulinum]